MQTDNPIEPKQPVTDDELSEALWNLYTKLSQSQRELNPKAKHILYSNLRKLYLR